MMTYIIIINLVKNCIHKKIVNFQESRKDLINIVAQVRFLY